MSDYVFTYTGPDGGTLSFGDGQDLGVVQIDGLDGFDDVRSSTTAIPRGHGGVPGQHFLPPRTPVFAMESLGPHATLEATRQSAVDVLKVSTSDEGTLAWERPGQARRLLYCRPVSLRWPTTAPGVHAQPKVAFEAADPRMYSATGKTASLDPYSTSGGTNDPGEDPKNVTVNGSDVAVTNDGNTGSPLVMRFYGPTSGTCTGVQLVNRTTGVEIDVQTDIVAGQILTVDMRAYVASTGARVVDLSGTNRFGSWQQTRKPVLVEPGSNLLRFTADGTTTGMSCRIDFADTWLS